MERKLGKLPARYDCRSLHFGDYSQKIAPPPVACDWTSSVDSWGLMLNDEIGDCPFAAAGHEIMAWTANAGKLFVPPDSAILSAYEAVTGYDGTPGDATDTGACLLDVLNYWRKEGIAGHQIGAFAAVRPSKIVHVQQAVAFLEGLYIGLQLPDEWLHAPQGQAWDVAEPNPNNGHCVTVLGYDPGGVSVVTWGYIQRITWTGLMAACDEAWAIVSDDMLNQSGTSAAGLNVVQMNADLKAVS
jgi:hypothetical protein